MFRLWGKIVKNNSIITEKVYESATAGLSDEDKIKKGVESLCYDFDIQVPLWFNDNFMALARIGSTRFKAHHFIEEIDFDYFEIEIISVPELHHN